MGHMSKLVLWLILKIEIGYLGGWGTWVMEHMGDGAQIGNGTWAKGYHG